MACFHNRCGERVTLLNENRTAVRDYSEFNHGLVLSAEPLTNDVLFEIKIDQKMNSWSGSVEIGVTECDPVTLEFPACASKLQNGSWIMSGNSILMNGISIVEFYGEDLEKLSEEDRVGVMRTSEGDLVFFINGEPQGVAAKNLPLVLYAVIDLYGKCVKVSITHPLEKEHNNDDCLSCDSAESECELWNSSLIDDFRNIRLQSHQQVNANLRLPSEDIDTPIIANNSVPAVSRDRLRFHNRCGSLVKLTGNQRTAERRRPLDEFNNGVVMTHRALKNDELFEIRLDRLVDKWSGSIEMGITTHNPSNLDFPATMTNMRSGTIMMSGCGILTNGKGTRREYGEFNLDELREGDRVGMMRRSNGNLHYFINGLDQGIAASKVPDNVWGVIDLYGMTIKVTIVDRDEREEQNLITRRNTLLQDQHMIIGEQMLLESDYCDRLVFHTNCGTHADVINNGRTAHRPNAADDFNNGVVLTSRHLKPGELFEVRLDKVVTKWAGSIEIGVTTHAPTELEFPFTMTNVRSGTWMMTGNGVMHNGTTILDQYGQNLDRLQVGDRVGVVRKESGTLHFFVNGNDQGPAASSIPERVYGVIDLYGQAAQVTIQDTSDCYSPDTVHSSLSNTTLYSDLRFHHVHGKNARICNNGQTALRPHAFGEFNDAIVFSSRPLRDAELFEVTLDHMVDRWSGSIELGVTAVKPDDVDLPSTATDLDRDTWMLSGCSVMENGVTIKNGYKCDLDVLTAGTRIGVMRNADKSLHFYLNGESQGVACEVSSGVVYAVVDLYGQCAQVSLTNCGSPSTTIPAAVRAASVVAAQATIGDSLVGYPQSDTLSSLQVASVIQPPNNFTPDHIHRFSECHGKSIVLTEGNRVASRGRDLQQCLVFSAFSLVAGELFEISLVNLALHYAGSIKIGVTSFVPSTAPYNITTIPSDTWYIAGNEVHAKNKILHHNFCPNLEWLRPGDRIGLKRTHDGSLRVLINSDDIGIAVNHIPETIYAVIELYGTCTSVRVTSVRQVHQISPTIASIRMQDSLEQVLEPLSQEDTKIDLLEPELESIDETDSCATIQYEFHENHGRNIELSSDKRTAKRVASYNQGIVVTSKPLIKGKIVEIKIGQLDSRWTSSLMCGVICCNPERLNYPISSLAFKKPCCIIASDWISLNGNKIKSDQGQKLDHLTTGSKVGVLLTEQNHVQIYVNGSMIESVCCELPEVPCYAVFDLYGQCQQITLLNAHLEKNEVVSLEQIPSTSVVDQQCEKADLESREKEESSLLLCSADADDTDDNQTSNNLTLDLNNRNSDLTRTSENNNSIVIASANELNTPTCPIEINRKCEYLKVCSKFIKSLLLPEAFFISDEAICYCNQCYQSSIQQDDIIKEMSPDYNPPKGWVKFPLKNFSNTQTDKWHVAFFGTKLCVIRAILDRGQPLTKEQQNSCNLSSQPCEKEESQSTQIVFCPSIDHSTVDTSFVLTRNNEKTDVKAAFQLLVRPGSYSTQQGQGDTNEWSTKETGAIVLHALLFRIQHCC